MKEFKSVFRDFQELHNFLNFNLSDEQIESKKQFEKELKEIDKSVIEDSLKNISQNNLKEKVTND